MITEANLDALYIENPILINHRRPSEDLIVSDALFLLLSYAFSFFKYDKKKNNLDIELDALAEEYKIDLHLNRLVKRLIGQYECMRFFLRYIYKPHIVFLVYPNGYNGYTLAFREKKYL
ncbi:hypothetical protein [Croceiramulus getboli]|nr:hypothetical protein P8624_13320 [Flavobacteriaceae bacterium YJPT1-3]